jgi:hypothetical protein
MIAVTPTIVDMVNMTENQLYIGVGIEDNELNALNPSTTIEIGIELHGVSGSETCDGYQYVRTMSAGGGS